MQKFVLGIAVVVIGLFAASRYFSGEPAAETRPAAQAGAPVTRSAQHAIEAVTARKDAATATRHQSGSEPEAAASGDHDVRAAQAPMRAAATDPALFSDDPHTVYSASGAPVGDRFAALAQLAAGGDKNAQYYALQIARHCTSGSALADDPADDGQDAATDYQIQLHSQMKAACVQVLSDSAYPEYQKLLKTGTTEAYVDKMRQTLEMLYGNEGPKGALRVAVSAIAQRPDDLTVGRVSNLLANLDISSVYFRPDTVDLAPKDPAARDEMMFYTLNLLSCEMGRPCGPNSYAVQSACLDLGACLPGADLMGVYQARLLNPGEMAYVRALLKYLQTIPSNVYWGS